MTEGAAPRLNGAIRSDPVRLVTPEGDMEGIVPLAQARSRARALKMDLVEVRPDTDPPIAKIMDAAARESRSMQSASASADTRDVRFLPDATEHEFRFKARHARRYLDEGHAVRVVWNTPADAGAEEDGAEARARKALEAVGVGTSDISWEDEGDAWLLTPASSQ